MLQASFSDTNYFLYAYLKQRIFASVGKKTIIILERTVNKIQGGAKRTHVFEMGSSRESFFLWGYLKSKVYVRKPRTVDDLKVCIREEIATVPQEMLVNVTQNFEERLRTCVRQEGRHLSDIIFRN